MTEPDWRLLLKRVDDVLAGQDEIRQRLDAVAAELKELRQELSPFFGPGARAARELEELRQQLKSTHDVFDERLRHQHERLERLEEKVWYPGKPDHGR